jgi:hypothetical protein
MDGLLSIASNCADVYGTIAAFPDVSIGLVQNDWLVRKGRNC